jgi:hypothetical protein
VLVVVVVLALPVRKAVDDEDDNEHDYGKTREWQETLNPTAPDLRLASYLSNDVVMDGVHRG